MVQETIPARMVHPAARLATNINRKEVIELLSQKITIKNPTGLHLRPAGNLCREAMKFKSKVTFGYGDQNEANAKSVLSVLGACIKSGDEIELRCNGEDESEALSYLIKYIEDGLGE